MKDCSSLYIGLSLTSLALLISVCINILLYLLRRRERQNKAVEEQLYQNSCERFEEIEEQLNQDNPIYGNICVDAGGATDPSRMNEVCYERMTRQCVRQTGIHSQDEQAEPTDISYASLDLTVNQKRKKKRKYQQKQNPTYQAQTHIQPVAQQNSLEMNTDSEAALPLHTGGLMSSRHSIYLNSHQVALETEERERERERMRERNREREMDTMNLHNDLELGCGQSDPSYEQGS